MKPDDITIQAAPNNGRPRRVIIATSFGQEHRDTINTDSEIERGRVIRSLAERFNFDREDAQWLHDAIVAAADLADELVENALSSEGADERPRESQATQMIRLVDATDAQLFHDDENVAYATIPVGEHHETWPVRSRSIRRWLARNFYEESGAVPGSQGVQDAVTVIEGRAIFEGDEHNVFTRMAEYEGCYYLDLANNNWQVVEVGKNGWRVLENSPVKFQRRRSMLPLPTPAQSGTIGDLRQFINIDEADWPLLVAWLVAAARPVGPYPVLALHGEQGSAKSTAARILRAIIDPNTAPIRSEPRNPRDLMIAGTNGWIVALDNLSSLRTWLSDALCRLSTGGGFSTRELYSDQDEMIFDAQRPVILNGIEDVATRGDLLDRSIILHLPAIRDDRRQTESALMRAFDAARPQILGALLDAVATGLANLERRSNAGLTSLPRMADFACWVAAVEPALGWQPGTFLNAYTGNRAEADAFALEASPVARVLIQHMTDQIEWTGTPTDLLGDLNDQAGEATRSLRSWPKTPQGMSGHLRRLAPNLRKAAGLDLEFDRTSKARVVVIRQVAQKIVMSVTSSQDPGNLGENGEIAVTTNDDGDGPMTISDAPKLSKTPRHDARDADDDLFPPQSSVGECNHEWVESDTEDGWTRTECAKCRKFRGRRPKTTDAATQRFAT